jgi:hypothetical protein
MAPTSTTKKSTTSKSKASSSATKTKTKRTVVKSASSTSTATKKKIVKVQRKPKTITTTNNNNNNNNKKKQPPKSKTTANINPSIILSKNLPVTSKPPILPTAASALRPGSLLQQICNGRDIQLSRSAVVTPNIEKEKGKYLLIFPGMFSFNNNTTTTKKAATTEEEEEKEVESDDGDLKPKSVNNNDNDNDGNDNDDDDEDGDEDDSPLKDTTTTTIKKKKISANIATTQIHSLGRIEGLRTDIPIFKIPFPNIQKDLIFPGRKVQTTSKYLIMSCSNKKNGTVQCKVRSSSCILLYCTIYYTVRITDTNHSSRYYIIIT